MSPHSGGSLVAQFGLDEATIRERLQRYRLNEEDLRLLRELKRVLEPKLPAVVEAFYDHVERYPEALRIITDAGSTLERLKKTNPGYFAEIFRGKMDAQYFESRLIVGRIHARIGLTPQWYVAAMSTYIDTISPIIIRGYRLRPGKGIRVLAALQKALNLDQNLVMEAYIEFGYLEKIRSSSERVEHVVAELVDGAEQLRRAAEESGRATHEVASATERLAAAGSVQSAAAYHASQSMTSLAADSGRMMNAAEVQQQALGKAEQAVADLHERVREVDREAAVWTSIRERVGAVERLRDAVIHSARQVETMNDRTRQIGRIVQTIEDIAAQTNLLALNAAIEAARAGEHGRGFAVVADEVRKLAEGSSSSAKEITSLVAAIQSESSAAVSAMEATSREADAAHGVAADAARALEMIAGVARQAAEVNDTLSASMVDATRQAGASLGALKSVGAAIPQVNKAIDEIADSTQESSAGSEEMSATAEEMSAQVEELVASITEFERSIDILRDVARESGEVIRRSGTSGQNGTKLRLAA